MYPTTLTLTPSESSVEVYCEIFHPMHSGDSGSAANYITQVVFRLNGSIHAEFFLGKFISRHPVISTVFSNVAPGDKVEASWQDIAGNLGQASATVK